MKSGPLGSLLCNWQRLCLLFGSLYNVRVHDLFYMYVVLCIFQPHLITSESLGTSFKLKLFLKLSSLQSQDHTVRGQFMGKAPVYGQYLQFLIFLIANQTITLTMALILAYRYSIPYIQYFV